MQRILETGLKRQQYHQQKEQEQTGNAANPGNGIETIFGNSSSRSGRRLTGNAANPGNGIETSRFEPSQQAMRLEMQRILETGLKLPKIVFAAVGTTEPGWKCSESWKRD